jgi:hypothetical protein
MATTGRIVSGVAPRRCDRPTQHPMFEEREEVTTTNRGEAAYGAVEQGDEADEPGQLRSFAAYPRCSVDAGLSTPPTPGGTGQVIGSRIDPSHFSPAW